MSASPPASSWMAPKSPRSSSEQSDNNVEELTPRSKVKALMAAIDDGSDQEPSTKRPAHQQTRQPLSQIASNHQRFRSLPKEAAENYESQQEDDSEGGLVIPRGRIAARLNAQVTEGKPRESDYSDGQSENAYARIRKQLVKAREENREGSTNTEGKIDELATETVRGEASPSPRRRSIPTEEALRTQESPSSEGNNSPSLHATACQTDDDDSDLPEVSVHTNRLQELVAKKRAEREAKEAEEEKKRVDKLARKREFEKTLSRDAFASDDISDDELAEKHLTQSARPTRKASKKALEEMNRETQRMNRNMQLAHQAKTKKKISKDSLFARFNFQRTTPSIAAMQPSSSTVPSSAPPSEAEDEQIKESPPTSPAQSIDQPLGKSILTLQNPKDPGENSTRADHISNMVDEDLPEISEALIGHSTLGKGKFASTAISSEMHMKKHFDLKKRPIRVTLPKSSLKSETVDLDSDSEFEIQSELTKRNKAKSSKLDAFDRVPAKKKQEGIPLLTLRALAHLNSPEDRSRKGKAAINMTDMHLSLQKRARLQAVEERQAKIEDLKARGILIQTAEDREKDQAEVEDLLEKARMEAEEVQKKEKKAAKKAGITNGDTDILDSSDDDGDYADEEDDESVGELSGSDEEDAIEVDGSDLDREENEDEESCDEGRTQNAFLDAQAEEDNEEEEEEEEEVGKEVEGIASADDDAEIDSRRTRLPRARRSRIAIEDDEDDDAIVKSQPGDNTMKTCAENGQVTQTVKPPQFPPMLGKTDTTGTYMGMTQAFAATMAETQPDSLDDRDPQDDSMAFLEPPPEPDIPIFAAQDSPQLVPDSQGGMAEVQETVESHRINLQFSQSQLQYEAFGPSQLRREFSEMTEIPDPTQDAGFALSSPAPERFVTEPPVTEPPSTVDTVIVPHAETSNGAKNRRRLVRKPHVRTDLDESDASADEVTPLPRDAFKAMKEKRKRKAEIKAFNKKKSEAKEMVEEQAAESEDEYAGLGGVSDDESGGEEDENVKAMMDHDDIEVDERQLAALHADRERANDEKAVEKLFKDINSGGLRRKRGAELDLSDSEDDAEARRRRKQREFAKMRKALLADEKVGQIAEDPKKLAFLRAIEDRENDEDLDLDFLNNNNKPDEDSFRVEMDTQEDFDGGPEGSQPQSQSRPAGLSSAQDNSSSSIQHTTLPLQETNPNMRPPATSRRTTAKTSSTFRKPSTLAEIRESVSFLVESPGMTNAFDASSSASEPEDDARDTLSRTHPRRNSTASAPVIDRLLLKRNSSFTTSSTSSNRQAFHDPTSASSSDFKVPSLLRRATTSTVSSLTDSNSTTRSTTYAATERATAGGGDENAMGSDGFKTKKKMTNGPNKSSVNCFAQEMERQRRRGGGMVMEGWERRRREERERKARERRGVLVIGGGEGFD